VRRKSLANVEESRCAHHDGRRAPVIVGLGATPFRDA
jgi:hypothetical protein